MCVHYLTVHFNVGDMIEKTVNCVLIRKDNSKSSSIFQILSDFLLFVTVLDCCTFEWQQIAYEYAKRRANLVLVARREQRLRWIAENARQIGANHVIIMAADVVKEDECRRFVNETISLFGRGMSIIWCIQILMVLSQLFSLIV